MNPPAKRGKLREQRHRPMATTPIATDPYAPGSRPSEPEAIQRPAVIREPDEPNERHQHQQQHGKRQQEQQRNADDRNRKHDDRQNQYWKEQDLRERDR